MSIVDEFLSTKDAGWSLTPQEFGAASAVIKKFADVYLVIDKDGQYMVKKDRVTTVRVRKNTERSNPDLEIVEELGLME